MSYLDHIRNFAIIAEEEAISRAARRLNVSTATASAHLDLLETHLGNQLFIRSTRQLTLTEFGLFYLKQIRPILDKLAEIERLALEFGATPRGALRVTAGNPLGRLKIAPLIARFAGQHPALAIRLNIDDSFRPVIEEQYHVAIRAGFDQPSSLIQRKIASNRRVLVASPVYLAGAPPLEGLVDLKKHTLLLHTQRDDKKGIMRFRVEGVTRRFEFEGDMTTNSNEALTAWLLGHCGVAQKSFWEVADAIAAEKLVQLLTDLEPDPVDFFAVSPFRSGQSVKVDAFIKFLREEFRKNPLC